MGLAGMTVGVLFRNHSIENVYLATLNRRPRAEESAVVEKHIASLKGDMGQALRDLQFALMSSAEFLLRH